jgi:hypothetical protein
MKKLNRSLLDFPNRKHSFDALKRLNYKKLDAFKNFLDNRNEQYEEEDKEMRLENVGKTNVSLEKSIQIIKRNITKR